MNYTIKRLVLSGTALITLTFAGQSFAAAAPFKDLADTSVKEKIISLQQKGIVHGVGKDQFLPDAPVTAAQAVQMLVKALDLNLDTIKFIKEPEATDYYPSANNEAWYAETLIIAAINDMGLAADLDPLQHWTREEFTRQLMLAIEKYNNLPMIKIAPIEIADEDKFTDGYNGPIQRAIALRIAKLDAGQKFNPGADISRADAAEMLYNALEYVKKYQVPAAEVSEPVNE